MPPFGGSPASLYGGIRRDSKSSIVTIDVGGKLFQTTKETLSLAGSNSLLSKLSGGYDDDVVPFVDRDPELFSVILSLLRTGNLPSKAKSFDVQDLIFESEFYGISNLLVSSQSDPSQFDAYNLEKSTVLALNGRDTPSAISTTAYGSVHVAHGSKITSFDWSLRRKSTVLTQFTAVDSLLALTPNVAAAGATDFFGLQIIDLNKGFVRETLNWENVTKSGSTVLAVGASPNHLFTSFESSRRNSSCVMVYDLNTMRPISEIAHYEIYGADLDSAIPATKLQWVPSHNLLMAAGAHSGPQGVSGNIRFWDVRSGEVAWELKEKVDCFADVTVSDSLGAMFKVGVNTGEVYYADLRNMDREKPWICLGGGEGKKVVNGKKEGYGCKVEAIDNQLFCSKGGNIELWSEVLMGSDRTKERVFRKNVMGRVKDMAAGNRVTNLSFGGNKMFVTRKDQQCVEVWTSVRGS